MRTHRRSTEAEGTGATKPRRDQTRAKRAGVIRRWRRKPDLSRIPGGSKAVLDPRVGQRPRHHAVQVRFRDHFHNSGGNRSL